MQNCFLHRGVFCRWPDFTGQERLHPVCGIHVNSVNPGAIDTDMMRRIEKNTFGDTKTPQEAYDAFAGAYFDKRYATAKEVAEMIAILASDHCSHMFGGQVHMDGGGDTMRP